MPIKSAGKSPTHRPQASARAGAANAGKAKAATAKPSSRSTQAPAARATTDQLETRANGAWGAFCGAGATGATPGAKVESFSSPQMNPDGRVVLPWDKPGDKIAFEMTVEVSGDRSQIRPEVWTNANHNDNPEKWDAILMKEVRAEGNRITYRAEIPIDKVGNYRATARVSTDGGLSWSWAGESGIPDIRFRPHAEEHDALNVMEVNVLNVNGGHGTLEDLMASGSPETNGKYTLDYLASQGINALWMMPPFERSLWDHRHPLDDAGSPYAAKNYFAVDAELSAKAKAARDAGASDDEVEKIANEEWKAFVDRAHELGIKVIVDVALNHVGHNFEFADLFKRYDASGKEIREVRKNDFSQVAISQEQLAQVSQRLDDNLPDYMEYVAPWMYASQSGDPRGARSADDAMAGGGQWLDTKQLYTGGNYGPKNTEQSRAVVGWLGRVLEHWAVDMGVDGFRLDHLTGLPKSVLEQSLNLAQAAVDRNRPGVHLYVTGEDFFDAEYNASHLDNIQDTWLRNSLLASPTPATIREVFSNPYFLNREMLNLNSHDEQRFDFGGNARADARLNALLPLMGGANVAVAGDEYGEKNQLAFKQHRPVESLEHHPDEAHQIAEQMRRSGLAKDHPALQDDNRAFLDPRVGGQDPDLLALSRFPDSGKPGNPVLVFANFNNERPRENAFGLDPETCRRLDPDKRYQVRDLMADDPKAALWSKPMTGRELLEKGIFVRLDAYQLQALELIEA
jgi:hypothetical protein